MDEYVWPEAPTLETRYSVLYVVDLNSGVAEKYYFDHEVFVVGDDKGELLLAEYDPAENTTTLGRFDAGKIVPTGRSFPGRIEVISYKRGEMVGHVKEEALEGSYTILDEYIITASEANGTQERRDLGNRIQVSANGSLLDVPLDDERSILIQRPGEDAVRISVQEAIAAEQCGKVSDAFCWKDETTALFWAEKDKRTIPTKEVVTESGDVRIIPEYNAMQLFQCNTNTGEVTPCLDESGQPILLFNGIISRGYVYDEERDCILFGHERIAPEDRGAGAQHIDCFLCAADFYGASPVELMSLSLKDGQLRSLNREGPILIDWFSRIVLTKP